LLETKHGPGTTAADELLNDVWLAIERANTEAPVYGQLVRSLVAFTGPDKPFIRTPKPSVSRKKTVGAFSDAIEAMYVNHQSRS